MNWLLQYGDTDILREATNPSAVFWHRARQGGVPLIVAGALTALLLLIIVLLVLGPEGTGVPWLMREWLAVTVSILAIIWAGFCGWQIFQYMPSRNDRVVILLRQWVRQYVDPLEEQLQALADHELRNRTEDFRQRIAAGESIESIRPEAYACVREASRRARAHRQFECQLIGGKVLEECNVAEMRTGEGKTIVCYMANYMKVLQGKRVHMVTVNDYLVKRDAEFARSIFELLGVTVGHISSDMETYGPGAEERRTGYACDITYGTNSEFGFDYLRDNMKHSVRDQVQGPQDYVVVDEVDSILIDEARTPLIISGPAHDDVTNYRRADDIARQLVQLQEQANRETRSRLQQIENNPTQLGLDPNEPKYREGLKKFKADPFWLSSDEADAMGHKQYFVVEADRKSVHMTEHGAKAAQQALGIGTFYDSKNMNWPHYIDNALRAHKVYQNDKEYVVQEDQITIVDEFTGRLMHGRQWSDGLHQAVEAKERVTIKQETQTLATITLQNLFKLYGELAGMTGTAMTEQDEFMKIYQLEVIAIPTNMPIRRIDYNDKIYKTDQNKLEAIVEEIRSYSQDGFPSDPHSVVDALKHAQRTLKSLKDAGRADDSVDQQLQTIHAAIREFRNGDGDEEAPARGYRKLMGADVGGRPVLVGTVSVESSERLSELLHRRYGIEHEVLNAKNHAREADIVAKAGQQQEVSRGKKTQIVGNVTISTNMAGRGTDIRLGEGVPALGGLHVVGTERHESRRIDNQLRGRCGRQGDPGSSRFFLSFDDELLRLFMGEWVLKMLGMLGYQEGMAIEDRRVSNGIEKAQKKVEERNFHIRKNLLEYDEVMDYQRKTFYSMRQRVVEGRNLSEFIWEEIHATVADAVNRYYDPQYPAQCVVEWANQNLGVMLDPGKLDATYADRLTDQVRDMASNEVRLNVQRTFGEYVDRDTPPEDWDVRGLTAWAAQFGLNLTQNQVRKGDPDDLLEQITTAAQQRIEEQNLTALETFVDADYGKSQLVRWAQEKFDIAVSLEDLAQANRQEAEEVLNERIRHAYKQREIEYPVAAVLDYALQRGGSNINEVGNIIARWANRKYSLNWTYEHFTGKNPDQIFRELRSVAEDYLTNGKLAGEIDDAVTRLDHEQLPDWARERFGAVVDATPIEPDGDIRQQLERYGYEMLRYELTQLERYVLLTTFDQVWKDHMYQMDLLRHSIGLRGYAEQDPKIAYKREGTRMFNEMLENIRERVTDLIFKVRIAGSAAGETESTSGTAAFTNMTAAKADATNAGFSTAEADQQAAMRQQGEGGQAQTIRRAEPKVGRNDPCPCGSGKKYKQCCGKPR